MVGKIERYWQVWDVFSIYGKGKTSTYNSYLHRNAKIGQSTTKYYLALYQQMYLYASKEKYFGSG